MIQLEHVGIAVDDVSTVVDRFEQLLNVRPYKTETVAAQGVRTHFLDGGTAKLELLDAVDEASPIEQFLNNRGEGLHHIAFEVEDLEATMERLREADFTVLSDTPRPGADDKDICFVHPKETHGVLFEFCETREADWTPREVPHGGGALAVYELGRRNRPTVLCLHGAAESVQHDVAPLMRSLEPQFHVLGVDLRGHGASSVPTDQTLSIDRFVEDARVALDAVDISSTHVFGFSLGASVALQLAQQAPERVDRLALLSPQVRWTAARVDTMLSRLDGETRRHDQPERTERLKRRHKMPERLFTALRAFISGLPSSTDPGFDTLDDVTKPTLVAALDDDPLVPLEETEDIKEILSNARLAVLPASRHALPAVPLDVLTPLLRRHFRGT